MPADATPMFTREHLLQLRWVTKAHVPGNLLAAIGFPVLFFVPTMFCCITSAILGNAPRPRDQPPDPRSAVLGVVLCATPLIWAVGSVSLILLRSKLNTDFRKKNTVGLRYALSNDAKTLYKKLLNCLDDLAATEMLEIAPHLVDGYYEHIGTGALRFELPSYVSCNVDVYCLIVGSDRYYFLPDCILRCIGNEYYTLSWSKAFLKNDNVGGKFRITRYRSVITHGRIRKDGGIDHRYNTTYGQEAYEALESINQYGVLSFKFGKDSCILLTIGKESVGPFSVAFHEWSVRATEGWRSEQFGG